MDLTFREASWADIGRLLEFMRAFYAIDAYPFDEAVARRALGELLVTRALGRVWLLVVEGESIGYIILTLGFSLEIGGRDAFVDELYVVEERRHQGVGRQALRFVLEHCRELGVHALHLEVERRNTAAQALYRSLGFRDHDRYLWTRTVE